MKKCSGSIARRLRTLGIVTLFSLLASLVNPFGYELHLHVYRYLSSRWLMNHIDEFLSPNFHGVAQQCFVAILLITIVVLAVARRKPSLSQVLVLLFATYSGLYASRSLPISSLLLTLIVAPLLTQALAEASSNQNLSIGWRDFLSRWQTLNSRVERIELGFRGHVWPVAAVALGLFLCAQSGKPGIAPMDECAFRRRTFSGSGQRFDRSTRHPRAYIRSRFLGRLLDLSTLSSK